MNRKRGEPVPLEERTKWPLNKFVGQMKSLIRTDYGGQKDPVEVILKAAKREGLDWSYEDAKFAHEREVKQVAGCRARNKHNFEALKLKFSALESITLGK